MTNKEVILDYIKKHPNLCDDCLSKQTNIEPRQQVNAKCNELKIENQIIRVKGICKCSSQLKWTNIAT